MLGGWEEAAENWTPPGTQLALLLKGQSLSFPNPLSSEELTRELSKAVSEL